MTLQKELKSTQIGGFEHVALVSMVTTAQESSELDSEWPRYRLKPKSVFNGF